MIEIAKQSIRYYLTNGKIPTKSEIIISDNSLLEKAWSLFITFYKNWNIVWSSWNIIETEKDNWVKNSIVEELILNSIYALQDSRFEKITLDDLEKIKIRIDLISKKILDKPFEELSPSSSGVIVIKKDYSKLSVILPNISPTLTSSKDFEKVLSKKLEEKFEINNYIVYDIESKIITNY